MPCCIHYGDLYTVKPLFVGFWIIILDMLAIIAPGISIFKLIMLCNEIIDPINTNSLDAIRTTFWEYSIGHILNMSQLGSCSMSVRR